MEFNQVCTGVIGVILVLFAFVKCWNAMLAWKQYRKSKDWLPVMGLVTTSCLQENDGGSDGTNTYEPRITYTYQVMGQSYESSRIAFGSDGVTYEIRKRAERVVARHPPGSQTIIHYNPDDPSKSVLERQYNLSHAIFGLFGVLGGLGLIYIAWV